MFIALLAPVIKIVETGRGKRVDADGISSDEPHSLTGLHRLRNVFGGNLQASATDADGCAVTVGVDIDAVRAGFANRKRTIGCVDFDGITGRQFVDADAKGSLFQTELHELVIKIGDDQVGLLPQADRVGTALEFRARTFVCVKAVTGGDREVSSGVAPNVLAGGLEGEGAVEINDAGGTTGRILFLSQQRCAR